ncbi:hypothetical protein THITH_09810 [Thioalkalivibrio paradoxus ARh 1]|uniref:Uncharacterized protein n=1 Tax=Thioalkalivibrio paradoxus ARh 1 TaxID=713585 RepID=W0DNE6_9GAMM|nr:hypothetical protein THITH_09810 [Thioalkalivibrio paradoxus ARh 1]
MRALPVPEWLPDPNVIQVPVREAVHEHPGSVAISIWKVPDCPVWLADPGLSSMAQFRFPT